MADQSALAKAETPNRSAPSRIWIASANEVPEWVVEYMVSGDIAADGSFDIYEPEGPVRVERGSAVFEFGGTAYTCSPRDLQGKLAAIVGRTHQVVAELDAKVEAQRARSHSGHSDGKATVAAKAAGDRPLKLNAMIGEPPSPQFAAVDRLVVDDTYQRSIEGGASQKLIVRIAENWDWRLCLPLLVSRRASQLYVIDGQHRLEAARLRGDIAHMPVVVFDFDDPQAEAELFVQANRSRRPMSKLDDFHAAVVAGDKKALAVNEIVQSAGLSVGRIMAWQYWKPGEVVFVTAVQRAMGAAGKPAVEQALQIIARAFQGSVLTGMGSVFEVLSHFIAERDKVGPPVDSELMRMVLAQVGIPGWKDAVDGAASGTERLEMMRRALIEAYSEAEAE